MSEMTPAKTHQLLEKLAEYVMNEVPRKSEVATKQEMNARFDRVDRRFDQVDQRFDQVEQRLDHVERDVNLILDGMDSQLKETEILKTEQMALKSGLSRVETRVEKLEKVH